MANRDIINDILKTHLLNDIFPRVMKIYNKKLHAHDAYMVIVGGLSVEMCAKLDDKAKVFLNNVFSEDIDIKIVVNNSDKRPLSVIDEIAAIRLGFLKELVVKLNNFIYKNKSQWDPTINLNVKLDMILLDHPVESVANAKVVSIVVEYIESKTHIEYPLVDTTIFTHLAGNHYFTVKKLLKSDDYVPYNVIDNVYYAHCTYMLFDNCRMLVERAQYLKEKKSLFALMKFTKYVIKFMSLYVIKKKIPALPKELEIIYDQAYAILQEINAFKIANGFKKMYRIKYDDVYISNVIKMLDDILKASNMKSIIKACKMFSLQSKPHTLV